MTLFTSEIKCDLPWPVVTNAALNHKYPNPINEDVIGLDVVDRSVGEDGILRSFRIMKMNNFSLPGTLSKILGIHNVGYISEMSEIDPQKKIMTVESKNVNLSSFLRVNERITYEPDRDDSSKTIMKKTTNLSISLPFPGYIENIVKNTMEANTQRGFESILWAVEKFSLAAEATIEEIKRPMNPQPS